jgi:lipopolysaccharide/colanic/teichoic acid biosynthesis glycosyltransferase
MGFYLTYKTMRDPVSNSIRSSITAQVSSEITQSGSFFRQYKIDELPQLWNVLIGNMSFVGPRPDVPGYADSLQGDDRLILKLRPGITGPASLKYKYEEEILALQDDPKNYNDEVIWPDKVSINKEYFYQYSFFKDLSYILNTIRG